MESNHQPLPPNEAARLLESLALGLTPPELASQIHVSRKLELQRINAGLRQVRNSASFLSILTAPNGSGKTHLLDITEQAATHQGIVVSRVAMQPEFRLRGNDKDSRALISTVITGLGVNGSVRGQGLETVLSLLRDRIIDGRTLTEKELVNAVWEHCRELTRHRLGDAVIEVVAAYFAAVEVQDAKQQARLLRWLRAGYDTRAAANKEIGIAGVIDGDSFLDYLRLVALLCRLAGLGGLLVTLDEAILLTRNLHGRDRDQNFDALLGIVNATAQGHAPGLGFIFGGTPDFLEHHSRGLLSHEALRTRLEEVGGKNSFAGPVMRLQPLTSEELFLMLRRTRTLLCTPVFIDTRLPEEALHAILGQTLKRLGAAETVTPREVVRKLAHVISALNQSPTARWQDVLQRNFPTTDNRNSITEPQQ